MFFFWHSADFARCWQNASPKLRPILRGVTGVALAIAVAACSTTSEPVAYVAPANIPSSKYAAIVVDVANGKILFQANADAPRHPASLTKMMTLYLVFEALDAGRISKSTEIPVSANAASRPPSKIGFQPGQSIDVDAAIRALAIKSANDVAVAVGEYLAGSEAAFAERMTAKARELGMTGTRFRNASGWHDATQVTTARDMAVLGMALRQRFPHHYHYFGMREFTHAGRTIRGHNRLLANNGVDGIKTGYIRASGFNVATSVSRNGRRLVAVVMGGESARSRDMHMAELIDRYLPRAASGRIAASLATAD